MSHGRQDEQRNHQHSSCRSNVDNGHIVDMPSDVQLPPKKRKISCDLLINQNAQQPIQVLPAQRSESLHNSSTMQPLGVVSCTSSEDSNQSSDIRPPPAEVSNSSIKGICLNANDSRQNISDCSEHDCMLLKFQGVNNYLPSEDPTETKTRRKQKKYLPDRSMSTEEMKAWRKEARRVRNRQSAAASRQKIRDRIVTLETDVQTWKSKYEGVMERIAYLEAQKKNCDTFAA